MKLARRKEVRQLFFDIFRIFCEAAPVELVKVAGPIATAIFRCFVDRFIARLCLIRRVPKLATNVLLELHVHVFETVPSCYTMKFVCVDIGRGVVGGLGDTPRGIDKEVEE